MVAERREQRWLPRARPQPDRAAKAGRPPVALGRWHPALRLPDVGLAERLKQSWVHRPTYQAVGKGLSSPSLGTAPGPPRAPFGLCTGHGEPEGKGSVGHWWYRLEWGAGSSPPPPYTPLLCGEGMPPPHPTWCPGKLLQHDPEEATECTE